MVAVLIGGTAAHAGWPWSNTESTKSSTAKKSSQPSAFSKMTTNTREFFGGMFGSKKPDPKKSISRHPYSPYNVTRKKEEKKPSWFSSWFAPKETPPPRSTDEWMKLKPIRP